MVKETVSCAVFESGVLKLAEDVFAAFLGGLALTGALFWLSERVFPAPDVGGRWFVETYTQNSARIPFRGMLLKYEIFIWQEGQLIRGTAEKIYESSATGKRQYEGKNRSSGEIGGYTSRHVFSPNRVQLHLLETGTERSFTSYFSLIAEKGSLFDRLIGRDPRKRNEQGLIQQQMKGRFDSMAGSSSGTTVWSRNRYDPIFNEDVKDEVSDQFGHIDRISAEEGLDEPA